MPFRIREARQELKMSQEELAEKSGVSRATISGLEAETAKTTTTDTLIKIAHALKKEVSDIFFT